MRVGEIIRCDAPVQPPEIQQRGIREKVENISTTELMRQQAHRGPNHEDVPDDVAARIILARRNPEFIRLLSIYRRTQKIYECHIQYTGIQPSVDVITYGLRNGVTFDIRLSDATIPIFQGAVGLTVNGRDYQPLIDFNREGNRITFPREPLENSEIDIDFRCGGRDMNVRGWWRSHRFEQEASERAMLRAQSRTNRVIRDGYLFVNGQRVGEIQDATIQASPDVTQYGGLRENLVMAQHLAGWDVGRHEQRLVPADVRRGAGFSYEYLLQYNPNLDLSDADEVGATIANICRTNNRHFVRLLSFTPIPENLIMQVYYQVDSADAPEAVFMPVGSGHPHGEIIPKATETPSLPDSRITIPKEDKTNRITLEDEEIGYRRADRSGILE
jgi:hypothetical protein